MLKIFPGVIFNPRMILDFAWPIQPKSTLRLSLNESVNEVCPFDAPTSRYFVSFNLDLLRKNVIPDFLPCFTHIRSLHSIKSMINYPSHHTFVGNHSNSKVINGYSVVLPAHNFRSHVSWCSTGFLRVIRVPYSCDAKVSDLQVALFIED